MRTKSVQPSREDILAHYKEKGFAVIPNALSAEELDYLNQLVEASLQQHPDQWHQPQSGAVGTVSLLQTHPLDMDRFIRHPVTFPLVQEVLLGEARFAQFDFRDVSPDLASSSEMHFHRDISYYGTMGGKIYDPDNPYISTYTCVIYYLSDVHDCCPAFCLVPNSHTYDSLDDAKAKLGNAYEEIPIRGQAGTAVLYNITTYHTRKGGREGCTHGRRTMHNYHSRASSYPLTNWATVPEVLALSDDHETRLFYSQWTPNQIKFARENYTQPIPSYYPVQMIK
ncbi:phytanoyl-CoA dioxygenase family protein [Paenibacillus sp. OV219]|uniref:phytanoyl-CoA dioxygenase family protein n=1 Tax=Paenibacillus sp. OV219 TaxID=1884377 RepID=UPI0008D186B3|nr:phytanoyl-CoA dioxygenase family protein [Paenibacillus sp. OV219]SEO01735.1 Phytanoyl-CoA dioxygenase (PhyH) [Paenibacillus sp. OV219]